MTIISPMTIAPSCAAVNAAQPHRRDYFEAILSAKVSEDEGIEAIGDTIQSKSARGSGTLLTSAEKFQMAQGQVN